MTATTVLGSRGSHAWATIDIGTNTTLLLVARVLGAGDIEVLAERAEITRLGRGIGRGGELGAVGIDATLGALREYARVAQAHGARIAAIGTEGLRRAPNARLFLDAAREILGVEVEVIDGPREAALTFRAVVESFPGLAGGGTALVVVDIGGGSTEIIVAEPMRGDARGGISAGVDADIRLRTSLPLGSVRLTERHMRSDPPHADEIAAARDEIAATLATITLGLETPSQAPAPVPTPTPPTLVGVAGTVTSLAAMAQNLASYDPSKVHGFRLSRDALDAQIARLMQSTQTQREAMAGLDPRRADVILAGALILRALVTRTGAAAVLVSDRGIRWGLLYDLIRRS